MIPTVICKILLQTFTISERTAEVVCQLPLIEHASHNNSGLRTIARTLPFTQLKFDFIQCSKYFHSNNRTVYAMPPYALTIKCSFPNLQLV